VLVVLVEVLRVLHPATEYSSLYTRDLPFLRRQYRAVAEENCAIRNLLVVIPSGYPTPSSSRLDPLVSSDLHFSSSRPICYSQHRGRPLPVPSGTTLTSSWISWRRDHASSLFLAFSLPREVTLDLMHRHGGLGGLGVEDTGGPGFVRRKQPTTAEVGKLWWGAVVVFDGATFRHLIGGGDGRRCELAKADLG
jgi:hypothetical protein